VIEGSPDDLVLRASPLFVGREARTVDVDEHVALWRARRPDGASRILRLLEETAPPLCYPALSPMMLQDASSRVFASSSAIRRGVDGVTQWALAPHAPGVNARALLDALGEGTAPLDVVIHVAAELIGAFAILDEQQRGLGADNLQGQPSWPPPRKTFLVRPFDLRHVHFAFNGDVTLDVVTDTVRLERPAFELARMELLRASRAWRPTAHHIIAVVVERLQGAQADTGTSLFVARHALFDPVLNEGHGDEATRALTSDSRIPAGRTALREMLRALFPAQHQQARDLEESAHVN
jgi:hypothetical protein